MFTGDYVHICVFLHTSFKYGHRYWLLNQNGGWWKYKLSVNICITNNTYHSRRRKNITFLLPTLIILSSSVVIYHFLLGFQNLPVLKNVKEKVYRCQIWIMTIWITKGWYWPYCCPLMLKFNLSLCCCALLVLTKVEFKHYESSIFTFWF